MTNRQKPLFVSSVRVPRSSYIPVALAGRYFQTPINRKEPTTLLCVCECEHVCVCVFESGGMRPQTQTVCVWDAALFCRSLFALHRSLPYPLIFFLSFLFTLFFSLVKSLQCPVLVLHKGFQQTCNTAQASYKHFPIFCNIN